MRPLTKHDIFSFVKSGLRIAGYTCLLVSLWGGAAILVVAEILGILEEL